MSLPHFLLSSFSLLGPSTHRKRKLRILSTTSLHQAKIISHRVSNPNLIASQLFCTVSKLESTALLRCWLRASNFAKRLHSQERHSSSVGYKSYSITVFPTAVVFESTASSRSLNSTNSLRQARASPLVDQIQISLHHGIIHRVSDSNLLASRYFTVSILESIALSRC